MAGRRGQSAWAPQPQERRLPRPLGPTLHHPWLRQAPVGTALASLSSSAPHARFWNKTHHVHFVCHDLQQRDQPGDEVGNVGMAHTAHETTRVLGSRSRRHPCRHAPCPRPIRHLPHRPLPYHQQPHLLPYLPAPAPASPPHTPGPTMRTASDSVPYISSSRIHCSSRCRSVSGRETSYTAYAGVCAYPWWVGVAAHRSTPWKGTAVALATRTARAGQPGPDLPPPAHAHANISALRTCTNIHAVLHAAPTTPVHTQNDALGAAVECAGQGPELLLPGGVPHRQLHALVVHAHSFDRKVNAWKGRGPKVQRR